MLTLAITTWNRDAMTMKAFKAVLNDDRISEIVIVDDASHKSFYAYLKQHTKDLDKVKLYRNERNYGCYKNKRRAVELSTNEWVILFDSDNVITPAYLDALEQAPAWKDVYNIFAPSYARPHFDYRHFDTINAHLMQKNQLFARKNFQAVLNTCNYVVSRHMYLEVWQDHPEPWTADTLFFNYCWLKRGYTIRVVAGMEYDHLVHDGSHYKQNVRRTGNMANELMYKLKRL